MKTSLFFLSVLFVLLGCAPKSDSSQTESKDWKEITIKYAQNFRLHQSGKQFKLELLKPGTNNVQQTIFINPEKTGRIINLTSTLNGMLCMLDERSRIIGVSNKDFIYDAQLKKRINSGKIKEYGGDAAQLSLEKVAKGKPNVILYDVVDKEFPNKEKLEKLGVKMIPTLDWLETHPLGKAEWIKVVGALTGKYDEACKQFNEIEANYKRLKANKQAVQDRPTVLCGNLIGDAWYTPSGDNYFAIMIADAGGNYRYSDTKGAVSLAFSLEQILKDNETTDYWLNPGYPKKKQLRMLNPHLDLLGAFSENRTYCYSINTNKFWETSAARPDLVLEDLMHIFHPEQGSNYTFNYYGIVTE